MTARRLSGLLVLLLFGVVGALFWLPGQEAERLQAQARQEAEPPPAPLYPGGLDHRGLSRDPTAPPAAAVPEPPRTEPPAPPAEESPQR